VGQSVRMRFRTDGWHYADLKASGETFENYYPESDPWRTDPIVKKYWDDTPKAEPGDVWRIFWYHRGSDGEYIDDRIAGYAICCIGCGRVHNWINARHCSQPVQKDWGESCVHRENYTSCWTWSGSAEEGTLTASPSLQVLQGPDQPCGWHGYIQDGDIHI